MARSGVRSLTHRAVDRAAGLPDGTTSYHAKTRAALLELVVGELEARTTRNAESVATRLGGLAGVRDTITVDALAQELDGLVDDLSARRDDMAARYALILELDDQPELRQRLRAGGVHEESYRIAVDAFSSAGLATDGENVDDLITLIDALVLERTVIGATENRSGRIIRAYLNGITERE